MKTAQVWYTRLIKFIVRLCCASQLSLAFYCSTGVAQSDAARTMFVEVWLGRTCCTRYPPPVCNAHNYRMCGVRYACEPYGGVGNVLPCLAGLGNYSTERNTQCT